MILSGRRSHSARRPIWNAPRCKTSMPAWRAFDPLPILAGLREGDEDDESLEDLIEQGARANEPDEPDTEAPPSPGT